MSGRLFLTKYPRKATERRNCLFWVLASGCVGDGPVVRQEQLDGELEAEQRYLPMEEREDEGLWLIIPLKGTSSSLPPPPGTLPP